MIYQQTKTPAQKCGATRGLRFIFEKTESAISASNVILLSKETLYFLTSFLPLIS